MELLTALLLFGEKVMEIVATSQSRKYLDKVRSCRENIREEWGKGSSTNHGKIEDWYAEIKENLEAYQAELVEQLAKKP